MAALKPLSYTKLTDLKTTLPPLKKYTVKGLLQKTTDLLRESENCLRNGDQEAAYELLYKYMGIVVYLQSTPDCKKDTRYFSSMLGGQERVSGAISQLEVLKNALQKRYEEKERRELALTSPLSQHHRSMKTTPAQNGAAEDTPGTSPGPTLTLPVDHDNNAAIDVHDFLRLLQNPQVGVLVMDCRTEAEFRASQIGVFVCLNVPAESIKPGLSAGKIQCELRPDSKKLWAQRSIKDHVILMDWASSVERMGDKLALLRRILLDWDPDCTYRNPLRLLSGGYESFMHTYPMHTTNPHYRPPHATASANNSRTFFVHSQQLEDIEYPDLSDIQMKDTLRSGSGGGHHGGSPQSPAAGRSAGAAGAGAGGTAPPPLIDRASKAAALRTIEKETREAERSRREALEVAKELSAVLELAATVPEADEQQTKRVHDQSDLLENRLMELDVRSKDLDVSIAGIVHDLDVDAGSSSGSGNGSTGTTGTGLAGLDEDMRQRVMEHWRMLEMVELERRQLQRELVAKQELDGLRRRRKQMELEELGVQERERQETEAARLGPRVGVGQRQRPKPTFDRAAKPRATTSSGEDEEEEEDDDEEELPEVQRNFQPESGSGGHGLTGLKNLGNTCYMNSIMQCLSNTDMLREYFVSDTGYRKQFRRTSKTQRQIADEVSAVMREIWLNKHRHISSNDLRRVVGQCKQIFRGMDQQDSHEFLTILMDWLHLDLQLSADRVINNPVKTPAEAAWLEFAKGKESPVMKLFYGQIKSTVKCSECLSESATFEGFSNLSLELPEHSDRCDIGDCLRLYFYGEKITGWNCPRCKQKRTAVKKLDISKLPPILVIHLKRFNVDLHSSAATYRKKQNFVRFPLHNFDMSEYIAPSERQSPRVKNTTFQLYGVSNHYGTMDRGHYTAFCKSSYYGRWFKYDDHIVSPMEESDVSTSAAYILFYATTQPR